MARQRLTPQRIRDAKCPDNKQQAFFWDADVKGLGIRVTKSAKAFIYQSRLADHEFRIKIGNCDSVLLEDARSISRQFAALVAQGIDPRQERERATSQEAAERQESVRKETTLGEVWPIYVEERRPSWSENYYNLHARLITAGGQQRTRAKGKTIPGPLASLATIPISSITADTVKHWLGKEKTTRPTQTRIAFEALRTFFNWCESDERYKGLTSPDACSAKIKRDNLRKSKRDDCLEKGQLKIWFESVRRYESRVMSAYIQTLLLTGARREEIMSLQWSDVDFRWNRISIMGKGGIPRDIPLTPYVATLLYPLPRVNQWVFSAKTGATGRLQSPTKAFQKMMDRAEIEGLTLHGLRRSFSTLAEWLEAPAGIIAQIQGHQPSAIAEKHYKKRPLDLLRMWHTRIEKWILEQAGLEQPAEQSDTTPLKLVMGK
ncbi:MAG: integrase family protein [Desulfobulbaceae bacterium]|nr:MAG: integrase family protein [Desulfobulbaceae bacterium]